MLEFSIDLRNLWEATEKLIFLFFFQDPLEAKHFELFAASADGNLCPQFDISNSDPMGDEDCLKY